TSLGDARGEHARGHHAPGRGARQILAHFSPTTPTRAGRLADASVDPTEARNDILGCFGRSDRRAQRSGAEGVTGILSSIWPPRVSGSAAAFTTARRRITPCCSPRDG